MYIVNTVKQLNLLTVFINLILFKTLHILFVELINKYFKVCNIYNIFI